jgi:phosphopantothenoylcysteine decarboxylase / phosphopantothenate---cysteine ligase
MLKGKKIVLGITGSIAAYKAAILVRGLVKEGAEVRVIMTPLAKEFITPVTLSTLSANPVLTNFFSFTDGSWNSHVDLGIWADLFLVAPATANTIGKMAHGIADNLLITTYLSARCPVFVAPAMDMDMFKHPSTQTNIAILKEYGVRIIEPSSGELASGLIGKGRMEEPEIIIQHINSFFTETELKSNLVGKTVMVTAGPTYEAIDPVRFIGNHSSGKMGYALADELLKRGANVILISGPCGLALEHPRLKIIRVQSANEMYNAAVSNFDSSDGAIMAAAVADFTPVQVAEQKVKREKENYTIELTPTADIAAALGKVKGESQFLIGFALETNDELENAKKKLHTKNLDFIVINSLKDEGAGFGYDTNKISILLKSGELKEFPLKAKSSVATDIINQIEQIL